MANLEDIRRRKLASRDASNSFAIKLSNSFELSPKVEESIAFASGKQILSEISAKEITREKYLLTLIKRSRRLGRHILNAVTEEVYDEAVRRVQSIDDSVESTTM